jgi:hypothetical protein
LINGPSVGHVLESCKDEAGRWVSVTLRTTKGFNITFISTYQVVDTSPRTAGAGTYANMLLGFYTEQGRVNPEKLREHHASDLVDYVKMRQQKGDKIVLAGDLNKVLGEHNRGMTRLVNECRLYDAVTDRHGETCFSTCKSGTRVIDYILVDRDLLDSIVSCGYEPFQNHILSDHRGIFIDFSTGHLFGNSTQPLAPMALRDISSKKPHQIAPYFKKKFEYQKEKGWFDKLDSIKECLKSKILNHELAEELYIKSSSVQVSTPDQWRGGTLQPHIHPRSSR